MSRANEPAYPAHGSMGEIVAPGLTVREHFAAMALQGLLADITIQESSASLASRAVVCADALIAELAKPAVPDLSTYRERVAARVLRDVCELPGYTSPDDQPDILMCKVEELHQCVLIALEQVQP